MATWNYRVVKTATDGETIFGIHEVYYDDDDKPQMYSTEPCPVFSEDLDGLRKECERFLFAVSKPVLVPSDFPATEEEIFSDNTL